MILLRVSSCSMCAGSSKFPRIGSPGLLSSYTDVDHGVVAATAEAIAEVASRFHTFQKLREAHEMHFSHSMDRRYLRFPAYACIG